MFIIIQALLELIPINLSSSQNVNNLQPVQINHVGPTQFKNTAHLQLEGT